MAVVAEKRIGNTRVKFNDEFCNGVTEEEIKEIMKRVAEKTQAALSSVEKPA